MSFEGRRRYGRAIKTLPLEAIKPAPENSTLYSAIAWDDRQ
jgi:hypothetical protein